MFVNFEVGNLSPSSALKSIPSSCWIGGGLLTLHIVRQETSIEVGHVRR